MVNKDVMSQLKALINSVAAYKDKELSRRSDWGSINFDEVSSDLKTVISLAVALEDMPIQYLSDSTAREIIDVINELIPRLDSLNKFSITEGDPNSRRTNLISQIHQACDRFYRQVGMWMPFLAYQKGDVSENIRRLANAIAETESKATEGLERIAKKEKEVDEIVTRTREASAEAGVAVFTEDFQAESDRSANAATKWLWTTAALAVVTMLVPVFAYFCEDYTGIEKMQLISKLASKIVVISVLFTATMWCGRIYKSLRHLSILNRHRAIGIKTFRAFSAAAADERTKDAVLLETTHSIFSNSSTGLIHDANTDQEPNIIQIAGKVMENTNGK